MSDLRIKGHLQRGRLITIYFDGRPLPAHEGETIATALIAAGVSGYGRNPQTGMPRGLYCNIGQCHSCLMIVDGRRNTRVCQTPVFEGCRVESQYD